MATETLRKQLESVATNQQQYSRELNPLNESRFVDYMARVVAQVMNAEACSVFIHDPATSKVWLKAGTNIRERGIEVSVTDSIVGQVISSRQSRILSGLENREGTHKSVDQDTGFVTREIICVPILDGSGSTAAGAIEVLNRKGDGGFNEADQKFLEETAEHLQRVVESIFLGQQAVDIAEAAITLAKQAEAKSKVWFGIGIVLLMLWGVAGVAVIAKLLGVY